MNANTIELSVPAMKRLSIAEDIIIALIMMSTLLLFTTMLDSHYTLPKQAFFSCLMVTLLAAFIIRLKSGNFQVLPRIVRLPLLLLVIWWVLGTSQAAHLQTALEGQYGRYNGLYFNLLLVSLFVVVSSIPFDAERFRRFLSLLFILTLMVCLYAFIQFLGLDTLFGKQIASRPHSSVGNAVALAAILLLVLPYALVRVWEQKTPKHRVTAALTCLVILAVIVMTGSRGPWVGILVGLLAGAVGLLLTNKSYLRDNLIKISLVIITAGVFIIVLFSITGAGYRLSLDSSFGVRLVYIDVAVQMIKDSPLFGFGFESYRLAYPLYRPIEDAVDEYRPGIVITPTMIHNDYLQLSADNGIPSMLFYLLFVGGLLWLIVKAIRSDKPHGILHIAILMMLVSYLIHGLSGWLETASSIMFWLILAVSFSFVMQRLSLTAAADRLSVYFYSVVIGGGLLIAIFYSGVMLVKVKQDYVMRQVHSFPVNDYRNTDEYLHWLGESSQDNAAYQDKLGVVYLRRFSNIKTIETYQEARKYFLRARALNPYDPYVRLHVITIDTIALMKRVINKPSLEAIEDLREVVKMDPNNPTIYQVRMGLYAALGNRTEERKNLLKMRQIWQIRNKERTW